MSTKPKVYTSSVYNINELPSDRQFEELTYRVFQYRVEDDLKSIFDAAYLMPGVAEKGIDILLKNGGENRGAVQCKFNTSGNIAKPIVSKEIIKFCLYYYIDKSLIGDLNKFNYYFIASGKFSVPAINLLSNFNSLILKEPDLEDWTESIIKKYSSLKGLTYAIVEKDLKLVLSKININFSGESDINKWLNDYKGIADEFFDIKKVVDNSEINKGFKSVVEAITPDLEKKHANFIEDYYKSAANYLDSVKFIGHETSVSNTPRNMTVTKLYVDPYISPIKKNEDNPIIEQTVPSKRLKMEDILKKPKNYVVLGDPGAGKSLMVKNIILRIIRNKNNDALLKNMDRVPFRIELRKYSELRLKENIGILHYLCRLLQSEYQITGYSNEVISHIIQTKPTIFFFDGLDEIFDTTQKNIVSEDISNFISINKQIKAVVTSRFIGYHDIEFPDSQFDEYSIEKFDEEQIDGFISNFYATQISNKMERDQEIESCKKQLIDVSDELKSNPLILSLMCMLAINNIIIPDSKLEVYRSITNTLVETRDKKEKELHFNLQVKSVRGTFGSLAFWHYCQTTEQRRINNNFAKKSVSDYLISKGEFSDIIVAEEVAKNFLDYAESRSIYFDNTFTHKTFLEYYAADYIFTRLHNGFKIKERDEVISKYISNSAWHIVFELLLAMIDEQLVENDVIGELLSRQLNSEDSKISYFLISQLGKLKNIGKEVAKSILFEAINTSLKGGDIISKDDFSFEEDDLFIMIQRLAQQEAFESIVQEILFEIEEGIDVNNENLLTNFFIFILEINQYRNRKARAKSEIYSINNKEALERLTKININLFTYSLLYEENIIQEIEDEIRLFGLNSVFKGVNYKFLSGTRRLALFNIYLRRNKFISSEIIKDEIQRFNKMGLTIELIERHISDKVFIANSANLYNLIKLYLTNNDNDVEVFSKLILSYHDKKNIKKYISDFKSNVKYMALVV
jgi:hypothetical protein